MVEGVNGGSMLFAWLMLAGLLVFLVGNIQLLLAMFRVSVWWGVLAFFFPVLPLVFVFVHWGKSWRPLLVQVVGILLMVLAFAFGGESSYIEYQRQWQQSPLHWQPGGWT